MSVWEHIGRIRGRKLATLDQGKNFEVTKITDTCVELLIGSSGKVRPVSRQAIEDAWYQLEQTGSLSRDQIQRHGMSPVSSSYVAAILAEIPGVTYTRRKITLRLAREPSRAPREERHGDVSIGPSTFEAAARLTMSQHFGVGLQQGRVSGIPKVFDFVSPDGTVVGDAKFYALVRGKNLPPAKFSTIAEHVWLLEKAGAEHKFLVFGNDRRVPEKWLDRHAHLVQNVEFYFLTTDGALERLN